jgi:hypothetical protein
MTSPFGTLDTVTKAELHELVDRLPDASVDAAAVLLQRAQDPVIAKLLSAPDDDEPETDAERAAVDEALRDESPSVPWEQARRELL